MLTRASRFNRRILITSSTLPTLLDSVASC
ncbi:Uncharacterised protein [Vibrio cholerae]|nr:Uncharacterised protein [Vibrio cholerae]